MNQEVRKLNFDRVRRSVVRISCEWEFSSKDDDCGMVIPGVIISIDNGSAVILVNSTLFRHKRKPRFKVRFPREGGDGYEEESDVILWNDVHKEFCIFRQEPKEIGYIQAVRFETQSLETGEHVDAFTLPREARVAPEGYCGGSIIGIGYNKQVSFHGCPLHEYGYLGTPLFNLKGDFVGMTYLDYTRLHAWTVKYLWHCVLCNITSICYVCNGVPEAENEGAMAEATGAQGEKQ